MAALQTGRDLHALFLRHFNGAEQPLQSAGIAGERFLHEDVHAFLHRILHVRGADVGAGGAHGDVAGAKGVDGGLVGVEAREAHAEGDVYPIAEFSL